MDFLKNFMSRFSGGMDDGAREAAFDQNPNRVEFTTIDGGGIGPTSVYNSWKDYDAGRSSGSYLNESPSFVNQFGKSLDFLQDYTKNKGSKEGSGFTGMIGGGKQGGFTATPIGKSGRNTLVQTYHPLATISTPPPEAPGPGPLDYIKTGVSLINLFCDIRLKTDIAPLESSDINDDLAEIAFFVKGLRDCA